MIHLCLDACGLVCLSLGSTALSIRWHSSSREWWKLLFIRSRGEALAWAETASSSLLSIIIVLNNPTLHLLIQILPLLFVLKGCD